MTKLGGGIITRFAPSPTGYLHLGHAYSAKFAFDAAQRAGGTFLVRIEDIDPTRCKPEYIDAIYEDLGWLGLNWPQPVRIQSQHINDYAAALDQLRNLGVLYPCFCTRSEIAQEAAAASYAPHGVSETIYPGTCRHLTKQQQADKYAQHKTANWRIDITKAVKITGALTWHDCGKGVIEAMPQKFGDVVLARKDVPTSYHLSVTVDDHVQGVTLVTRGEDLFEATHLHRLLQKLLGYQVPEYHHHPLLTDAEGRRYAKRDKAKTLRMLREQGININHINTLLKQNYQPL